MSKVELHTAVEETIACEDLPGFTIKKINLGRIYLWTPWRAIYLSTDIPTNIRYKILETLSRQNRLFEANRTIYRDTSYETINHAIEENNEKKIKDILRIMNILSEELKIPVEEIKKSSKNSYLVKEKIL